MLAVSNGDSKKAFALIDAFEGSEITTTEFSDGIQSLSPEAIQVAASILNLSHIHSPEGQARLWQATLLCRRCAARNRGLC
jgi:hypothetical protein